MDLELSLSPSREVGSPGAKASVFEDYRLAREGMTKRIEAI